MKCDRQSAQPQTSLAPWLGLPLLLGFLAWPAALSAQQTTNEQQAFDVALRAFQDGVYDRAEQEFSDFARKFAQSERLPEAILFQARAGLQQGKLVEALKLLTGHVAKAGAFADQYRYWEAKAHLQSSNYQAAAETYALLLKDFTDSVLSLEASYGEALARFRLGDFQQIITLLQRPDSTFQKAVKVRANDELVARGHLLLAEAQLQLKDFQAAERSATQLAEAGLVPEFKWRRLYLICRIQLADQRPNQALSNTTNLLSLATASGQPALLAETIALQADILQRLNQLDAAAEVYSQNVLDSVPPAYRRHALVHAIELTLAQGKIVQATHRLQDFLTAYPEDAASDLALLTLGEVHLRLWTTGVTTNLITVITNAPVADTNAPLATNHLQKALVQFDQLITTFTNSPFLGKAHLNRGWCYWLDSRIPECLVAFKLATEQLSLSEDLAVACFKLADAQSQLNDATNALQNYRRVVNDFEAFPRVRNTLFDHALYQILRVCLQLGDVAGAADAMQKILEWFPESYYRDRGMLLVGQGLTQVSQPANARALFTNLAKQMPESPLVPEIELATARTYVQENKWEGAITQYAQWLERFPTNALRPRAEFNHAWASYQAGQGTNALVLFTNFVARFPQHELAPRAQFWVATFFYDQRDFVNAEKNFQNNLLLQNTNFAHQARMMAGRAAFARQGWKDAYDHFTALVNDDSAVKYFPDLAAEAFFALGDTIIQQDADPAKPIQKFILAREAFSKIPQLFPTNHLAPQAWGRIGDCYLQMGTVDALQYESATNAYLKVLNLPAADVSTRSQAEVGIAHTLILMAKPKEDSEKAKLRQTAFDHYYSVVIEKNLRPGEAPDPFWFKEAALNAGRLAEETGRWEAAINIYTRLGAALPHLLPAAKAKINNIRKKIDAEKS